MIELNKENYEAEVLEHSGPVLVDFWSPKCDPCMALLPDVEAMSAEFAGKIKFCKVNALENRRLCIAQKVMGLPTILFYQSGERVTELTGDAATPSSIREELAKL